jgi:MarR family transcriptional regulator, organic hydroperoxide resistance regulator
MIFPNSNIRINQNDRVLDTQGIVKYYMHIHIIFIGVHIMSCFDLSGVRRCACGNLRRTTRTITQFYDQFLQKSGLLSPQFSLLLSISLNENVSVGGLESVLLMDQTTVTRNIEMLRKNGYVTIAKDDADARRKSISITERGSNKLAEAMPLWEQAQSQIEKGLGSERYRDFLKTLKDITQLVQ